ncbi:MAG: 2,3-cyclic 3-phosphodiesterase [Clostridia bacterium]|nr:2,3-cyclic 3-phosphodiesterase [Clostridia bacterium]
MRLFIALHFSLGLRQRLAAAQDKLRLTGADVKWVEMENLHLTLKFLGEVEGDKLKRIELALENSVEGISPFNLKIEGVGVFPGWQRPRVLWAGIRPEPMLTKLQSNIEARLVKLGYPRAEKFSGHLTLGRVRSNRGLDSLMAAYGNLKQEKWGEEQIRQVFLVESQLTPKGPYYRDLAVVNLG